MTPYTKLLGQGGTKQDHTSNLSSSPYSQKVEPCTTLSLNAQMLRLKRARKKGSSKNSLSLSLAVYIIWIQIERERERDRQVIYIYNYSIYLCINNIEEERQKKSNRRLEGAAVRASGVLGETHRAGLRVFYKGLIGLGFRVYRDLGISG